MVGLANPNGHPNCIDCVDDCPRAPGVGETGEERRGKFDEPVRTKKFGEPAKTRTNPQEVGWRKSGACEETPRNGVALDFPEATAFPRDSTCAPQVVIRVGEVGEVGKETRIRGHDDDAHPSMTCAAEEQAGPQAVNTPALGDYRDACQADDR